MMKVELTPVPVNFIFQTLNISNVDVCRLLGDPGVRFRHRRSETLKTTHREGLVGGDLGWYKVCCTYNVQRKPRNNRASVAGNSTP